MGLESELSVTSLGDKDQWEGSCIVYITEKLVRQHVRNATYWLFATASCLGWLADFISTCFYSSKSTCILFITAEWETSFHLIGVNIKLIGHVGISFIITLSFIIINSLHAIILEYICIFHVLCRDNEFLYWHDMQYKVYKSLYLSSYFSFQCHTGNQ